MINPLTTYDQARSLLSRWGYRPIKADVKPDGSSVSVYAQALRRQFPGSIWNKHNEELFLPPAAVPDFDRRFSELVAALAKLHNIQMPDIRRIMAAELDPLRRLGGIELQPQPLDDFGEPEDHAPARIVMDKRGRDRLIAALIEGRGSIDVYGPSGGGYELQFEVK